MLSFSPRFSEFLNMLNFSWNQINVVLALYVKHRKCIADKFSSSVNLSIIVELLLLLRQSGK